MKRCSKLFFILLIVSVSFTNVYSQPQVHFGWPQQVGNGGAMSFIEPNNLAVTILPGGDKRIVCGTMDEVAVYDINGTVLATWGLDGIIPGADYVCCGPLLGDLDGDAIPEVAYVFRNPTGRTRGVAAFTLDGEELEDFTQTYGLDWVDISTMTLCDIDNDGLDEAVYSSDQLYALNGDGTLVDGFPWALGGDPHWLAGPVVYCGPDIETSIVIWVTQNSEIHAKEVGADEELAGWPNTFTCDSFLSPPVIIPTDTGWLVAVASISGVVVWDQNGDVLEGFPATPQDVAGTQLYHLSAGDVDGDSVPELLFRVNNTDLHIFDLEGNYMEGYPTQVAQGGYGETISVLRAEPEADGMVLFGSVSGTVGVAELHGYQGQGPMGGFPVEADMIEDVPRTYAAYFPPVNGVVNIVLHSLMGTTYVFDWTVDTPDPVFDWPMPANTPGGNRLYGAPAFPVGEPDLEFSTIALDYGEVPLGVTVSQTFQVVNSGDGVGIIDSIFIDGDRGIEISVLEDFPYTILPGATNEITVQWEPMVVGVLDLIMNLYHNDEETGGVYDLDLIGIAGEVILNFSETEIDFGTVEGGDQQTVALWVANYGTVTGTIDSVEYATGLEDVYFEETFPLEIPAEDSTQVHIVWVPEQNGDIDGIVLLHTNDFSHDFEQELHVFGTLSDVNEFGSGIPENYFLSQNHPNPFNAQTMIRFGLKEAGPTRLGVYNVMGQKVASLVDTDLQAGYYSVSFDAASLSSGVYYYRIESGNFKRSEKMLLVK